MLGEKWHLYNIKSLETHFSKTKGIQDVKKIYFKKVSVKNKQKCRIKLHEYYKYESESEVFKYIIKKKQSFQRITLSQLKLGHSISEAKNDDVKNLLTKFYGQNWSRDPNLSWYIDVLNCSSNNYLMEPNDDEPSTIRY